MLHLITRSPDTAHGPVPLNFRRRTQLQECLRQGKLRTRAGDDFEVEFAERVAGPLCLGYGSHFGLEGYSLRDSLMVPSSGDIW
jgi:hypothetical protein